MMADVGIQRATRRAVDSPLPVAWLGKATMPKPVPDWASILALTSIQHRNLAAQLSYSLSAWDYVKIGTENQLGAYQFSANTLEQYKLLSPGSTEAYGSDAVNYRHCWRSTLAEETDYDFLVASCTDFLDNNIAQDYLAYKILQDTYTALTKNTAVLGTDSAEVVAGMLAVAWYIGAGSRPTVNNPVGTGAYAWRYAGVGTADAYYVQGRYSVAVLSRDPATILQSTKSTSSISKPATYVWTALPDGRLLPGDQMLTRPLGGKTLAEQGAKIVNLTSPTPLLNATGTISKLPSVVPPLDFKSLSVADNDSTAFKNRADIVAGINAFYLNIENEVKRFTGNILQ